MSTPLSKRLFAGMAAASLGLAVTACGGGDKAADVDYDDSVTACGHGKAQRCRGHAGEKALGERGAHGMRGHLKAWTRETP